MLDMNTTIESVTFGVTSTRHGFSTTQTGISPLTITAVTLRGLEGLLALLGNTLTIFAIVRFHRLRTTSNAFIANLAAADILSGISAIFYILLQTNPTMSRARWLGLCHIYSVIKTVADSGNLKSILLIGIDRFVYINYPMRYHRIFSPGRVVAAISISWTIPAIVYLVRVPYLLDMAGATSCVVWNLVPPSLTVFNCAFAWIQIILLIGFYCFIFRLARQKAREGSPGCVKSAENKRHLRRGMRVFRMAFTVLGLFTILTVPGLTVVMLTALKVTYPYQYIGVKLAVSLMWYINSMINPVIYAWQNRDFRRAFGTLLRVEKNPLGYNSKTSLPESVRVSV